MKNLKKTTPAFVGQESHYHVVYLNDESGAGGCSLNADHTHQITYQLPQEQHMDQMGNVVAPAQPGGWIVEPAPDGHTHDIIDYKTTTPKKKEDDQTVVDNVLSLFKTASEIEGDSIEKGKESEDFYSGEQWDAQDTSNLNALNRASLTINFIGKYIDELSGYQRQQRTDLHYLPQEGGDQRVADLLNHVSKFVLEQCFFEREESKVFEDQSIVGRGIFNIYMDFSQDLRGEIRVEKFPWDRVRFGPHEKEDLEDCEYLTKDKMFSRAKVEELWPDKSDQVKEMFDSYLMDSKDSHVTYSDDQYLHSTNKYPVFIGQEQLLDIAKKEIRVIECWRKFYTTSSVIVQAADDFYFNAYGWSATDIASARTIPGVTAIQRPTAKIRISKIAGSVLLSDEYPADLPVDDFYIIPVYARKRGSQFWGKVEPAKDPQREINKRHSQAVDIGNKMSAYGWFIDQATFVDSQEKEKFKRSSSSPGFVVEVTDSGRVPQKVEGTKFPAELVQLLQLSSTQLSELMNITVMPGGANESGAALLQRQRLKLTGNEYLFDGLSFAKKKLGRLLVSLIQRYYSAQRIFRIVSNIHQKQPVQVAGQSFDYYTEDEIVQLLEEADLSKYDVVVTEASYGPTMRLAYFLLLGDLAKSGLPVPPDVLVELTDMPDSIKQKILAAIAAQNQQAGQQEQVKANAEVTKTLIAKGIIPPAVQQQMGMAQGAQMPGQAPTQNGYQNDQGNTPLG